MAQSRGLPLGLDDSPPEPVLEVAEALVADPVENWDHDHCAFCTREFVEKGAPSDDPDAQTAGYAAIGRGPQGEDDYVAGLTDTEIAAALDCRRGTADSLLSRGRSALQANPLLADLRPRRLQGEA